RRKRRHSHERAFQTAHVAFDSVGEEFKNLVRQFDLHAPRFFPQDREPRLDRGRLKLGGQAPFKTRNQAMLEICNLRGRSVAREHDLFMSVEESVESVKKFFLRTFLAAKKLDVVNAKQIRLAIAFPEFDQVVVLDRVDEFIDEKLA